MAQTNVEGVNRFFTGLSALMGGPKALDVARASVMGAQRENYFASGRSNDAQARNYDASAAKTGAERAAIEAENAAAAEYANLQRQGPALLATPEGRAKLAAAGARMKGGLQYGPKATAGFATFVDPNFVPPSDLSTIMVGTGVVNDYAQTPTGFGINQLRQRDQATEEVQSRERVGMDKNAGDRTVGLDKNQKDFQGTQYTADQRLTGEKYGADAKATTDRTVGLDRNAKDLQGTQYTADQSLTGKRYDADQSLAGVMGAAGIKAGADERVGMDRNAKDLEGTKTTAQGRLAGDVYKADQDFRGKFVPNQPGGPKATAAKPLTPEDVTNISVMVADRMAAIAQRDPNGFVPPPDLMNRVMGDIAQLYRQTGDIQGAMEQALARYNPQRMPVRSMIPGSNRNDTVVAGADPAPLPPLAETMAPPMAMPPAPAVPVLGPQIAAPPAPDVPPPPAGQGQPPAAQASAGMQAPPGAQPGQIIRQKSTGRTFLVQPDGTMVPQ